MRLRLSKAVSSPCHQQQLAEGKIEILKKGQNSVRA
jgi:hypothetical protein